MSEKYVQFISPSWRRYLPQRQKQWQTAALCNDNSNNKMEICIVQANMSLHVLVQPRIQDTIGYSKHKRWTKLGSSSNQHWLISMSNSVPCPVGWLQRSSKINALLDKYVVNKYLTPQYRCINRQVDIHTVQWDVQIAEWTAHVALAILLSAAPTSDYISTIQNTLYSLRWHGWKKGFCVKWTTAEEKWMTASKKSDRQR